MKLKTNLPSFQLSGSKLKTTLTGLLLLILSTESARATETILKKDQSAPFYGVLVSEKQYRSYVYDEKEIKSIKGENAILWLQNNSLKDQQAQWKNQERSIWGWFFTGLALGLASALAVK